jgi:hypothetical protein
MLTFFVMRIVVVAILACACLLAQIPPAQTQPVHESNQGVLTVRVESPRQESKSPVVEYLNATSELAKALAWPIVFGILIFTQRESLKRILEAVIKLLQNSNRVKIGDMIDLEVDRSAKEAESQEQPPVGVSPKEIEAAARVGRITDPSDLSFVRARMLEFAREYEATRSNMKPGRDRTRAMNAIVAKMRTLGIAAQPLLSELSSDLNSPGKRLSALSILQLAPDINFLDWVVERMTVEQPFVFFHASLSLLAMVRTFGFQYRAKLDNALNRSIEAITSFAGGPPDANTLEILREAQAELSRSR